MDALNQTHLGLVLYPVRCLLELTNLPDNMRNLREQRQSEEEILSTDCLLSPFFVACQLFISFCYLQPSQVPDKKIDTILLTVRAVTKKRETKIVHH